jgi:hypothetical protein
MALSHFISVCWTSCLVYSKGVVYTSISIVVLCLFQGRVRLRCPTRHLPQVYSRRASLLKFAAYSHATSCVPTPLLHTHLRLLSLPCSFVQRLQTSPLKRPSTRRPAAPKPCHDHDCHDHDCHDHDCHDGTTTIMTTRLWSLSAS